MVDQNLGNAWDMEHIHEERAAELLTGGELIACNDFHKVLNDLLGNTARQGRILKCTERQETFNDHISIGRCPEYLGDKSMDSSSLLSMCSGASWDSSKSRLWKGQPPILSRQNGDTRCYVYQTGSQTACMFPDF